MPSACKVDDYLQNRKQCTTIIRHARSLANERAMVKHAIKRPYDRKAARRTRKKNRELKQQNHVRTSKGLPPLEKGNKKKRSYHLTGKYVGKFSGNRKKYNRLDLLHLNNIAGNATGRRSNKYTGKYPMWYKMNEEKKKNHNAKTKNESVETTGTIN